MLSRSTQSVEAEAEAVAHARARARDTRGARWAVAGSPPEGSGVIVWLSTKGLL